MAHGRKLLRHAVVRILKGERPEDDGPAVPPIEAVGDRVFPNRSTPLWPTEDPSIFVYFEDEDADNDRDVTRGRYDRHTILVVEEVTEADQTSDDRLDDHAEIIERLLLEQGQELRDPVTGDKVTTDIALVGSRCHFVPDESEGIVASMRTEFRVEWPYEVPVKSDETSTDFEKFKHDITANVGGGAEIGGETDIPNPDDSGPDEESEDEEDDPPPDEDP